MGCKQSTVKSPSIIFPSPLAEPTPPVYVKSVLKKNRTTEKKRFEKLSSGKRKPKSTNKSVNFNERVQVKLRTPTPKETRYSQSIVTRDGFKQKSFENHTTDEDIGNYDDDDDQISVVSSQDDPTSEQKKSIGNTSHPLLQRNQPNGFWYKNSTVTVLPSPKNSREKPPLPPQPPPPPAAVVAFQTMNVQPSDESTIFMGNHFRIRRKVPTSATPSSSQTLDLANTTQSPVIPIYPSTTNPPPSISPQRPLSNSNAFLIEHPVTYPTDSSPAQTTYYAFARRSANKTNSKEKK